MVDETFSDRELLRYSRHIMLPEVEVAGQRAIARARALIVGLGGLGSPAAMYLAAAGVGALTLVDDDRVDESNLQRQIIHSEKNAGIKKVDSAANTLKQLNTQISVFTYEYRLPDETLGPLLTEHDVVLDCSDNFTTRLQLNRLCLAARVPLVTAAAIRLEGQLTCFDFRDADNPCYQCLYRDVDEENLSCAESGVLSPLVGVLGSAQAVEALKCLAGFGQTLVGRLQLYDAAAGQWREFKYRKDPGCPVCG